MFDVQNLSEPTLLLDKKKCLANIEMMARKAEANGINFRPHFKTHQSREVGSWYKDFGVKSITTSSVMMAHYFADDWTDITVAFPINAHEYQSIDELAGKVQLNLNTVNAESVQNLAARVKNPLGVFIKIDVGYNRTGILPSDRVQIEKVLAVIKDNDQFTFKGFLAHSGHSYGVNSDRKEALKIHQFAVSSLTELKKLYSSYGDFIISIGDTPTCSMFNDFSGVDEIRPGNFVFYDLTQNQIGSCDISQIAVCMLVPVVAKHPDRNEIIVYGGGVHFSKDVLIRNGVKAFGQVVPFDAAGWGIPIANCYVSKLSQEHGTIKCTNDFLTKTEIGDWIGVLPVHSCMAANAMGGYTTLHNEQIDHLNARSFKY